MRLHSRTLNIGLKIILTGLLVHAALFPDLPQYQMKGMFWRLVFYPLAVGMVWVGHALLVRRTGKSLRYPHGVDALITLCATNDMLGNTFNFYNSLEWWDDAMHLVNSVPWALVFGLLIVWRKRLSPLVAAGLTLGYGAVSHICWEIAEYLTFLPKNDMELPTAYRDTIGDLALSLIGTVVASIIVYKIAKKRTT